MPTIKKRTIALIVAATALSAGVSSPLAASGYQSPDSILAAGDSGRSEPTTGAGRTPDAVLASATSHDVATVAGPTPDAFLANAARQGDPAATSAQGLPSPDVFLGDNDHRVSPAADSAAGSGSDGFSWEPVVVGLLALALALGGFIASRTPTRSPRPEAS